MPAKRSTYIRPDYDPSSPNGAAVAAAAAVCLIAVAIGVGILWLLVGVMDSL